MNTIYKVLLVLSIGFAIGYCISQKKCSVHLKDVIITANEICQEKLSDKHHCISFINEECGYTKGK